MKKLELEQMEKYEGGSTSFILACGLLSAALGTVTFGLGLVAGVACWVLGNDVSVN